MRTRMQARVVVAVIAGVLAVQCARKVAVGPPLPPPPEGAKEVADGVKGGIIGGVIGGIAGGLPEAAPAQSRPVSSDPPDRNVGPFHTEAYDHVDENGFHRVSTDPLSTYPSRSPRSSPTRPGIRRIVWR